MNRVVTMHGRHCAAAGSEAPAKPLRRLARALAGALQRAHERAELRHELERVDHRLLRDMGVSRADVEREARRWFWRP